MMDWISSNAGMIGLLFFFVFFIGMALWVFRPGAKSSYDAKARIPLNEDESE